MSYRRKNFTFEGKTYRNLEIPGEPVEKLVWDTIAKMINRPKEIFALFKRQSIESHEYDVLLKERELNQREIDKLETKENGIEMDYYDGKLSEEKKDKFVKTILEQKQSMERRNSEIDKKMDSIIKMEETRIAFEKFQGDFDTNIDNLTFEQKKLLVELLVETIEVTTVSSQLNLNIKLRFDQSKLGQNGPGYEPKKSSSEPKDDNEKLNMNQYGTTGATRTRDLFLRREAL